MSHTRLICTSRQTSPLGWATLDTAYGSAIAIASDLGLCALGFSDQLGEQAVRADLSARNPRAPLRADPAVADLARRILDYGGPLHLMGTAFQHQVWQALSEIPRGETRSYAQIAAAIGKPRAAQAVGTAVGANPISLAIPCHRVLPMAGGLGQYHWGAQIKERMLANEGARFAFDIV